MRLCEAKTPTKAPLCASNLSTLLVKRDETSRSPADAGEPVRSARTARPKPKTRRARSCIDEYLQEALDGARTGPRTGERTSATGGHYPSAAGWTSALARGRTALFLGRTITRGPRSGWR